MKAGRLTRYRDERTERRAIRRTTGERVMAKRAIFDVNFLDRLHEAGEATRQSLFLCVDLGHLDVYASYEMLRELMGMAKSKRRALLVPYAGYVLRLTRGKILNRMLDALESELRGCFQLELDEDGRRRIVGFLEQMAGGHVPSAAGGIGQEAIDEKNKAKTWFDDWYADIVARTKKQTPEQRAASTFDRIQREHWENTARATVLKACSTYGINDPERMADSVLANPENYPHVRFPMRVFAVMLHRYFIEKRKRDAGDLYDLWQMSYLVDMDVFVTNERKLPDWYADVFGNTKRVMTAEEFLARTWC
jgi:hypothetical protein